MMMEEGGSLGTDGLCKYCVDCDLECVQPG